MSKCKKFVLIILVFVLISVCYLTFLHQKDEVLPKEDNVVVGDAFVSNSSDITFINVSDGINLGEVIPTLDKFGVLNDSFTFTIKNNSLEEKEYILKLVDDNSTILNKMIRYELYRNNESLGIHTLSDDGVIDVNKINNDEISYSIKLWLDYNSDVKVGALKKKVSVEVDSSYFDQSTALAPQLADAMIPVYYDYETLSFCKSDIVNSYYHEWYNYEKGIWANAVNVDSKKREEYMKSPVGTKIDMDDITAMWVWIPRFSYSMNNDKVIVNFVNKDEESLESFNFNNKSLSGFWVSKFEAGLDDSDVCITSSITASCNLSDKKLLFKPNISLMNRITMANLFYAIRRMELKNNIYGFINKGTKLNNDGTIKSDSNNIDIHMIKNSEWESIALLSNSQYGRSDNDIYPNNSYFTGKAYYNDVLYNYDIQNYGTQASTTNNISGVYDMVGGKSEYVMLNGLNSNIFNKKSNSGFNGKVKDYYYNNASNEIEKIANTMNSSYSPNNEPVTRGGYKNVNSNILSLYGAKDYVNKISLETNSRAVISIIKEN